MIAGDKISILAGGYSVIDFGIDLEKLPGKIIAVNESAIYAPRVDAICSMDRLWTENRWRQVCERAVPTWIRRSAIQNIADRPPWLTIFECNHESTDPFPMAEPVTLNGTNSGVCALNLALRLIIKDGWPGKTPEIFLFGFDMQSGPNGEAYWHPSPPWQNGKRSTSDGKYRTWSQQFAPIAEFARRLSISVFDCSPNGAIQNFRKLNPALVAR